jgi:signal transduction histidine kinase
VPEDHAPAPEAATFGPTRPYGDGVESNSWERLGVLAGLIASLAVGVAFAVDALWTGGALVAGPAWLWWVAYLGYLAAFVWDSQLTRPAWVDPRVLVLVQAGVGLAAYLLAAGSGWVPVLFVVTAATAAYELSRRATLGIVGVQTAVVPVGALLEHGPSVSEALFGVVVYGSFQVFAVMMIWTQRREAEGRRRLAEAHERLEQAHAELRAATAMLEASSRSAERLRIARDLHDLVGHQLTALTLELEVATHVLADGESLEHVSRARRLAKDLLADVREAVGELRAPRRELRETLDELMSGLPRPRVDLEVEDDLVVDDAVSLAIVRCIQEIVSNVVRHAGADALHIELRRRHEDGGLVLFAADDGRGTARLQPGHGLTGIRERIEALGGTVDLATARGKGMQVEVRIPDR